MMGIGTIRIKMFDGIERILQEVRYIPKLKRNLVSLGIVDLVGYRFRCENGSFKVYKGSLIVMKAFRNNGLYTLDGKTVISGVVNVLSTTVDKTRLWHQRLGHVSQRGLEELYKQGLLCGDKIETLEFCEHCVKGKAKRLRFSTAEHRTEGVFDYVHSDLWGPSRVVSHGGARYFLSIIDDYSRKLWVYLMKNKNDTFKKFKDWKVLKESKETENRQWVRILCIIVH